jgi:glycolate oxidase
MASLASRLLDALGPDVVRTEPEDLAVYGFDAYSENTLPSAVVVPSTRARSPPRCASRASAANRSCRAAPGPGLCGGAVPARGGLVVSIARMNRILELDVRNRRARVQPGTDQPRPLERDRRARHLLRARSVEPEDLDDRRQRRHQRRRPALP